MDNKLHFNVLENNPEACVPAEGSPVKSTEPKSLNYHSCLSPDPRDISPSANLMADTYSRLRRYTPRTLHPRGESSGLWTVVAQADTVLTEPKVTDLYPVIFEIDNHEIEQEPRGTIPLESQTVGRESARQPR